MSLELARDGFAVGVFARRRAELESLATEILDAGGRVLVLPGDVADRDAVHGAARTLEARFGPVDLLVANAGIGGTRVRGVVDAADVERVMRVNVLGAVYGVEAVLPGMRTRRSGHLVAVSSVAGYGGLPGAAAYSASKAAMTNYFESLRIELRGSGVDVTVLLPGWIRTPMTVKNAHRRPFLLELDEGVEVMMAAIRRRRRVRAFPWPIAGAVRGGRWMPRFLYDWLLGSRRV